MNVARLGRFCGQSIAPKFKSCVLPASTGALKAIQIRKHSTQDSSIESKSFSSHAHQKIPDSHRSAFSRMDPRCSMVAEVSDEPGSLYDILRYFWKYDVSLTSIESRPVVGSDKSMTISLTFVGDRGDPVIEKLIGSLKTKCKNVLLLDEKVVPWFPRHISELDNIANRTMSGGEEGLESDHPGFTDEVYIERRKELAEIAGEYLF